MADAGITDMLLTFNILGDQKLKRLAALAKRTDIKVVADNEIVVEGLGRAGEAAGRAIDVLVECDTGMKRNGVQSPEAAADLARRIARTKSLRYGGLMTYPKQGVRREAAAYVHEARTLIAKAGLETPIISTGGAPEMWSDEGLEEITEYRTGTYVFFDRSLVMRGVCAREECGLTMLATVVSRPTAERAMIDAGTKSLTSDLLGLQGYGIIPELGDAKIYEANEEHGYVDLADSRVQPSVGDRVRVLPNHVCPVVNLFDRVVFVRGDEVLGRVKVDARGLVQ
jgi:D-serine deaminase-like pyridoxal phosphate-dependent protein